MADPFSKLDSLLTIWPTSADLADHRDAVDRAVEEADAVVVAAVAAATAATAKSEALKAAVAHHAAAVALAVTSLEDAETFATPSQLAAGATSDERVKLFASTVSTEAVAATHGIPPDIGAISQWLTKRHPLFLPAGRSVAALRHDGTTTVFIRNGENLWSATTATALPDVLATEQFAHEVTGVLPGSRLWADAVTSTGESNHRIAAVLAGAAHLVSTADGWTPHAPPYGSAISVTGTERGVLAGFLSANNHATRKGDLVAHFGADQAGVYMAEDASASTITIRVGEHRAKLQRDTFDWCRLDSLAPESLARIIRHYPTCGYTESDLFSKLLAAVKLAGATIPQSVDEAALDAVTRRRFGVRFHEATYAQRQAAHTAVAKRRQWMEWATEQRHYRPKRAVAMVADYPTRTITTFSAARAPGRYVAHRHRKGHPSSTSRVTASEFHHHIDLWVHPSHADEWAIRKLVDIPTHLDPTSLQRATAIISRDLRNAGLRIAAITSRPADRSLFAWASPTSGDTWIITRYVWRLEGAATAIYRTPQIGGRAHHPSVTRPWSITPPGVEVVREFDGPTPQQADPAEPVAAAVADMTCRLVATHIEQFGTTPSIGTFPTALANRLAAAGLTPAMTVADVYESADTSPDCSPTMLNLTLPGWW